MKAKRIMSAIVASAVIAMGISASALEIKTYSENLKVYYNGTDVYADTQYQPIIINERAMVRLVPIFEKMGWSNYSYDDAAKSASFYGENITYVFSNDSSTAIIRNSDGSEHSKALDVPATIYNDVFYVPLRAFCEMVGNDIQWNADERSVYVSNGSQAFDTIYPMEYMGKWYGFGTDGTESQAEITVTALNENQISVDGDIITFVNAYTGESEAGDPGNGRLSKMMFILGKDSNGELAIEMYSADAATGAQYSQSMCCYRQSSRVNIQDFIPNGEVFISNTETDQSSIASNKLTEDEAKLELERWIGDLGTWQDGKENVLVCDGVYNCDGKEYYQFRLRGLVSNHLTTLTWYVISVDGTEIFEGQCNEGYLNKY